MATGFIAEICSNHNGQLKRALALIETAAILGCVGVKFQLFRLNQLFAPEVLAHPDYRHLRQRRAWELPLHWLPVLSARCREHNLQFGVSPFHLEAVEQLLPFVDFYKLASYVLLYDQLLKNVAATGKPVVLSTGMATRLEIRGAMELLIDHGCRDLTVLHCVSSYPADVSQIDPDFATSLTLLQANFAGKCRLKLGWSDHTVNPASIYYFCFDSEVDMVEFHLDLDGKGYEYKEGHCWLPREIGPVIKNVVDLQERQNDTYMFGEAEEYERGWRADPADGLRPLMEVRRSIQ